MAVCVVILRAEFVEQLDVGRAFAAACNAFASSERNMLLASSHSQMSQYCARAHKVASFFFWMKMLFVGFTLRDPLSSAHAGGCEDGKLTLLHYIFA